MKAKCAPTSAKRHLAVRSRQARKPSGALAKPYEPTASETAVLADLKERRSKKAYAPHVTNTFKDGVNRTSIDHPDESVGTLLLMNALGTPTYELFRGVMDGVISATGRNGVIDETQLNFVLAFVAGVQPRDEVETLLAAQMAVIHSAVMTATRRLSHVSNLDQLQANSNSLNKLARTYAAQMTALKQYRSTGSQTVTVQHQHVTVSDGGQAIVGNVTHGGGERMSRKGKPTP
ncbi:hypothetical protein [Alsobacter sp. R-9]